MIVRGNFKNGVPILETKKSAIFIFLKKIFNKVIFVFKNNVYVVYCPLTDKKIFDESVLIKDVSINLYKLIFFR